MPKRVAIGKINLGGGEFVMPGESYNFSAEQVKELEAMNPPVIRAASEERAARAAVHRQQPDDDNEERQVGAAEGDEAEEHPVGGRAKGNRGKGRAADL